MSGDPVFFVFHSHTERLKAVDFIDVIHYKNVISRSRNGHLGVNDVIVTVRGVQEHHFWKWLNIASFGVVDHWRLKFEIEAEEFLIVNCNF